MTDPGIRWSLVMPGDRGSLEASRGRRRVGYGMTSSARKMAAAVAAGATVLAGLALAPTAIAAPPADSPSADAPSRGQDPAEVAAVWTPAARAAAIPRDLVIDERGLGYLKGRDGSLEPYGHAIPARAHDPAVVDATAVAHVQLQFKLPCKTALEIRANRIHNTPGVLTLDIGPGAVEYVEFR